VKHEECLALLEQFGAVKRVILIGLSPFAVAEFASVEGSRAAKAALDSWEWERPQAESRQLFVEYAQVNTSNFLNEEQHPLQVHSPTIARTRRQKGRGKQRARSTQFISSLCWLCPLAAAQFPPSGTN
jgi:hypothetical protein